MTAEISRTAHQLSLLRDLAEIQERTTEEACDRALGILGANASVIPFALLYLMDSEERALLVGHTGVDGADAPHAIPMSMLEEPTMRLANERAVIVPLRHRSKPIGLIALASLDGTPPVFLELIGHHVAEAIVRGTRTPQEGELQAGGLGGGLRPP